jgi:hypothetical protein
MRSGRLLSCFFLLPCCCLFLTGCRGRRDLVEAELRSKDRDLYEIRDELYRSDAYNEALRREVAALRGVSTSKVSPELASQLYTVTTVTLGRQTGGYDEDGQPGDEALQVLLEPKDPDGHTIKAPGTVEVQAFEITREGLKVPLSTWTVSPDQLRRSWRSGLLSTGYSLVLPWKIWPSTEKLRVVVHFRLDDGRLFEADKDVTIRLGPQHRKPMPNAEGVVPPPEEVPPPMEFRPPPPRKLEGPLPPEGWNGMPLSRAGTQWREAAASPLGGAAQLQRPVMRR